ncbi:MAG: ABC transporter permease [Acidobacteria bacterium]|nr:ABC transporter permease [Acidobacteriota bacterium]
MMKRIWHVAWREFVSTVATKAFVIGVLVFPAIISLMIVVIPMVINAKPPAVQGEVAVIDHTGVVFDAVKEGLTPDAFLARQEKIRKAVDELTPDSVKVAASASGQNVGDKAVEAIAGDVPNLEIVRLGEGADITVEKKKLAPPEGQEATRLALLVIAKDAVDKSGETFGSYQFYKAQLDDRIAEAIEDAVEDAIIDARIGHLGMNPDDVRQLTRVRGAETFTVTEEGIQKTNKVLDELLPAAFMALLLMSVMTGGQYLMTTTIEEKSSRVVEVILSAVSPLELMTGKILGQMAVGFLLLAIYAGMGIAALVSFSLLGLVDLTLFIYLGIFYVIAYFVIASLMAAIGAAVNELREAQSLMTPVMLIVMLPWMLWFWIAREPDSMFATIASFVPPINTFVMMLRMSSSAPPPLWQVWVSIGIGILSVWAALWFAAKVFRIGLLMHGKPPDFKTLIQWVRMA